MDANFFLVLEYKKKTMIDAEEFAIEQSYKPQENTYDWTEKSWTWIPDSQGGSYSTAQASFETPSLTNSGSYSSLPESFVALPLVAVVQATGGAGFVASRQNAFALSLKNGYHHLIDSMQVQISNNDVVTQCKFVNMKIHYDIVSSYSQNSVKTYGESLGFYGIDNPFSEKYTDANSAAGMSSLNNGIRLSAFSPFDGWGGSEEANVSRRERMLRSTSYDPENTAANSKLPSFLTAAQCNTVGKNYMSGSNSTSTVVYQILATIPLSCLHDIFKKMPLTKNLFLRIVLNLNTSTSVSVPVTGGAAYSGAYTVTAPNTTIPFMLSPISPVANQTATAQGIILDAGVTNISATLGLGRIVVAGTLYQNNHMSGGCRLYVKTYKMSPQAEQQYFSSVPTKKILYLDTNVYTTNLTNIAAGSNISPQITSSVSRPRGLLIIPQISASVHGSAVGSLQGTSFVGAAVNPFSRALGSPISSPFSSSPATTAPFARITNFNVKVCETQVYKQNVNFGFEQYHNEVATSNAIYGNALREITSGLIGQSDWFINHGYVYVDLSKIASSPAEDMAPRQITVYLTNGGNVTCDYWVSLMNEREISISTATGQLII